MAFQPIANVPVRVVDTTIDVVSRGTGDQDQDDVFVTAQLELLGDLASGEEALLILPLASEAQQQPILRYTQEPITGSQVFTFDEVERSDYDDAVIERLEALADGASRREQRDFAVAVGRAAKSISTTIVRVQPGQRTLRLFYGVAADRVGDREFEFSVIGPLPSFVIQAGGSIGVVALLPRNVTVTKAEGLFNPSDPTSLVPPTNAMMGGRPVWGWYWQNDPLFVVRYRY